MDFIVILLTEVSYRTFNPRFFFFVPAYRAFLSKTKDHGLIDQAEIIY